MNLKYIIVEDELLAVNILKDYIGKNYIKNLLEY